MVFVHWRASAVQEIGVADCVVFSADKKRIWLWNGFGELVVETYLVQFGKRSCTSLQLFLLLKSCVFEAVCFF